MCTHGASVGRAHGASVGGGKAAEERTRAIIAAYEHLRRDRINEQMGLEPHVRPYDRGALRNCVYFWCGGNLPPTRVAPPATSIQAPPGALNYVQPPFGEVSPTKFSSPPFGL